MNNSPIGVFDSGVGGLTAVKELSKIMPNENIIYFGDTGRVPYGTRSEKVIKKYATQVISYLASLNVKAILAACGTVSSNFLQQDYNKLGIDIPYITVIDPSVKEAAEITKNKRVGVIATNASINSEAYTKGIKALCPDCYTVGAACPLLIPIVENGYTDKDHPVTKAALEMYLRPVIEDDVDTLVLGCTHFPLLVEGIEATFDRPVKIVDSGAAAARATRQILKEKNLLNTSDKLGSREFYVTDSVKDFAKVGKNFLSAEILNNTTYVDLEKIDKDIF